MSKERVLLVDDDTQRCSTVSAYLASGGCEVSSVGNCRDAEDAWRTTRPDLAVLDYSLPDGNALGLLPKLKAIDASIPVIVLTAHASIDLAVEAVKLGAVQFLTKPVELGALLVIVKEAFEIRRTRQRQLLDQEFKTKPGPDPFLGKSVAIKKLEHLANKVAPFESPILIEGETGTGKGVLARWLHAHGPRASEPFVDLNCGGLSGDLLETELFGHEKGAFSGAAQSKAGLLEVAHRGTIFLDEIGDVDLDFQPKLLKVLQEKQFRHLGGARDRRVDIRLLAATRQDIAAKIKNGTFRSDLYSGISSVHLMVPALRERIEDIPILAEHILQGLCSELAIGNLTLSAGAATALQAYSWPGNIRELRNVLERAVLLRETDQLTGKDLHLNMRVEAPQKLSDRVRTLEEFEREYIAEVLSLEGGRVSAAAAKLGIPRSSLYNKIKAYGWGKSPSRSL